MKKILMLITALFLFGCDRTYTVEEFENDDKLTDEYRKKCQNGEIDGDSLNCENSRKAIISRNEVSNASWK